MAQEILSAKLRELEEEIEKLCLRIRKSESAQKGELESEISALREECVQAEKDFHGRMEDCKAHIVREFADEYGDMEREFDRFKDTLISYIRENKDKEEVSEEKALIAEYSLDFAIAAAKNALLISMDAIDAQREEEEKEGRANE